MEIDNPGYEDVSPGSANQEDANGLTHRHPARLPSTSSQLGLATSDQLAAAGDGPEKVELKKTMGLVSGIALIVGTMIGSGIFISPGGVISSTGSIGLALVVWAGCGILAILGSLCYAELGTEIPKSGGEYIYLGSAFGPVPAFLHAWLSIVVVRPSSMAIICLAFAHYAMAPVYDNCGPPQSVLKLTAVLAILVIMGINCYSVKLATRVQNFFAFAKLAAIGLIIVGGIVKLIQGNIQHLGNGFEGTSNNVAGIALAFYDGLWAYDGWNNLNYATEELQNPTVNLPRAILIGLPLVMICYILVNISYLSVMSAAEIIASPAVAVTWADRVIGPAAIIIPISVAMSTFGAANGTAFTGGRLCFVAAREGHLMSILSMVHVKKYTPLPSMIFTACIAILMIIPGDISALIDFFSFTAWLFYGATFAALLVLRFRQPDLPRPYKVPIVIPIFMLLASLYLVIAPIVDSPKLEYLYATLFILAGLIFYVPFIHFKIHPKFIDKITTALQLLMEVSPTEYEPDS
ncbi:b(0,+)-type amino acid transporter 1 isoform X2 [Lingula anatina]|uniref:b(0,+)-type amino acid transporter 1 n=1 Tax=Lingula anatina TaxID=7574 RepID=A0A1S3H5N8_LINAN|nr:b(0,+)-type amino acid transporter 1 isoform X2 [Lingula anatina]|eukprot:XP_013381450.1 b(0,+)-type amino acid transporter 1 isoform X2 [Lingula anatina]